MLAPLNCVQINTLLHKLPQRTQLPQKRNPLLHSLEYVINLALGREPTDTETDTAVGALIAVAEGAEDVAWFEGGGGASAAGRQGDVFESHQQGFALDVGEGNVDAARVVALGVAVLGGVFEGHEAGEEAGGEVGDPLGVVLYING